MAKYDNQSNVSLMEMKDRMESELASLQTELRELDDVLANRASTAWVAACGGYETPFTYRGEEYLYMWNPVYRIHAYYKKSKDLFVDNFEMEDVA